MPPQEAARLIREARRDGDSQMARDLRASWDERVTICTVDTGLTQPEADPPRIFVTGYQSCQHPDPEKDP